MVVNVLHQEAAVVLLSVYDDRAVQHEWRRDEVVVQSEDTWSAIVLALVCSRHRWWSSGCSRTWLALASGSMAAIPTRPSFSMSRRCIGAVLWSGQKWSCSPAPWWTREWLECCHRRPAVPAASRTYSCPTDPPGCLLESRQVDSAQRYAAEFYLKLEVGKKTG